MMQALEGLTMFALNQGEVCACPSRALIQESIAESFMTRALQRVKAIWMGNPLESSTMMGAQVSEEHLDKVLSYIQIGREEGAQCLVGGDRLVQEGDLANGFYMTPTIFKGNNRMRLFQEEIFGPVLAVTTFKNEEEALDIANDTPYGTGSWGLDA
jgi:NAD-dependent aldehyde dehydrogenases